MNPQNKRLPEIAMGAGLLGLCLRLALYRVGFDEKNILSAFHPLHLACLLLTVLTAVYLAFSLRNLGGSNDPAKNSPRSPLRILAMTVAATLTVLHGLKLYREADTLLAQTRVAMAFAGAGAMFLCALPGMARRRLHALALSIITVFYALDMLSRYQVWSGNPQLPDYFFQIFAGALLSLCSYHRLAFATGLGKRRMLLFCSLMSLCLCLLCAAGPETRVFYLGGAFWAGACIYATELPIKNEQEEAL